MTIYIKITDDNSSITSIQLKLGMVHLNKILNQLSNKNIPDILGLLQQYHTKFNLAVS